MCQCSSLLPKATVNDKKRLFNVLMVNDGYFYLKEPRRVASRGSVGTNKANNKIDSLKGKAFNSKYTLQ